MAKDKNIFTLGFCSSSKTSSTDLACSCAPYFTYAEDTDWAKFNLGAVQGTLPQPAARWTSTSDRHSGNSTGPDLKFDEFINVKRDEFVRREKCIIPPVIINNQNCCDGVSW